MTEFLSDLREHWNDGYWWAEHQIELAVIVALVTGFLGVGFAYLEARVRKAALA